MCYLGIFSRPTVPPETHNPEECLPEYSSTHLRHPFTTVYEYHRHLLYPKSYFIGGKLHLYLKPIALETNLVKFNGFEYPALVTLETGRGVVNFETGHQPHVLRREIAHQHSTYWPVDDIHSAYITRPDGHIVALVMTGGIQSGKD